MPSELPLLHRAVWTSVASLLCTLVAADDEPRFTDVLDVTPQPIASDKTVVWDYDIVYVRARRAGDEVHKRFYTDFSQPVTMQPGADLMLLHPDGTEELLVEGGTGSITDPFVSFDGEWVYYAHLYDLRSANQWNPPAAGADIFKIHLRSRRIVRLTNQRFVPNTGAAPRWTRDYRRDPDDRYRPNHYDYGVFNMGPCPLPGGRLAFTSNREGYKPSNGYPAIALQLFVMDDRDADVDANDPYPSNIEKIGHLNIAGALHPVVLTDGRILFSTLESQGIRSNISWGIWTIHPDGTNWKPLISAFDMGGAANGFHFQTQLSDGSIVIEGYYNQNNSGFGTYVKLPAPGSRGADYPAFGPAWTGSERNTPWRFGRHYNAKGRYYRMPFMPTGSVPLTPFARISDAPADPSIYGDKESPKVGKVTHPSGAPDNHLLTIWSPGPTNHQYKHLPQLDGGIYLLKNGQVIDEPGDLLLIKNDPGYNESWPRAVVPYERIYGVAQPRTLPPLTNDGSRSPHLPAGTPFGLVGTSSMYKRESYPNGQVPTGSVTATYAGQGSDKHATGRADPWRALDPFTSHGNGMPLNWHNQGADAGLYDNNDIHAVRILAMEPTTDRQRGDRSGRRFHSHAQERLRILGEIPVRKFPERGEAQDAAPPGSGAGGQPLDPDGNPDTSFLAKIPADTAFTFQTIDRRGMVLNMAQTWHQLRPGEVRTDCGGCHAHSQKPTEFSRTAAARTDYDVWDLTSNTPLVTDAAHDASKKRWDVEDTTGLRFDGDEIVNVEYFRDIQPILKRSCTPCHTKKWNEPAGNLVLDADDELVQYGHQGKFPGTYYRLALDEKAQFGHKPPTYSTWGYPNASRYIRKLQSRRSLLTWKLYGERLDGFDNDDHPSEPTPGAGYLEHHGERYDKNRAYFDIDLLGERMPPRRAIEGTYEGPDGRAIRVEPLRDEDRRTITRWIDLGCPIDLDHPSYLALEGRYQPAGYAARGYGWMLDDNRPILTVSAPRVGESTRPLERIIIGTHDYMTGLDPQSLSVTASIALDGAPPGHELRSRFRERSRGVWVMELLEPIASLSSGILNVAVKDRQGNEARVVRSFSVTPVLPRPPGNRSQLVPPGGLPVRVHVYEDYETDIEKRWWLRGRVRTDNAPPDGFGHRACRATASRDFDRKMGDGSATHQAVVFNPVPGPPMGPGTRLSFRYFLKGTDTFRVQIYSLSRGFHRYLSIDQLEEGVWRHVAVDMTACRRPDGSGGPLAKDERIDDIQFYVDPRAELWIDDIVLYEAAPPGETRPFPKRILFTGWFDTGKQGPGNEWPGDFEIVEKVSPLMWDVARAVLHPETRSPWLRIHLRGRRPLSPRNRLRFAFRVSGKGPLRVVLRDSSTDLELTRTVQDVATDEWTETEVDFDRDATEGQRQDFADEIHLYADRAKELVVDDVLLYEPGG